MEQPRINNYPKSVHWQASGGRAGSRFVADCMQCKTTSYSSEMLSYIAPQEFLSAPKTDKKKNTNTYHKRATKKRYTAHFKRNCHPKNVGVVAPKIQVKLPTHTNHTNSLTCLEWPFRFVSTFLHHPCVSLHVCYRSPCYFVSLITGRQANASTFHHVSDNRIVMGKGGGLHSQGPNLTG